MGIKQSEVYDKVLVTEFCVFSTRRGTVTWDCNVSRFTIGYLWEKYEKKLIFHHVSHIFDMARF